MRNQMKRYIIEIICAAVVYAAMLAAMCARERTFMDRLHQACPSGTAERIAMEAVK